MKIVTVNLGDKQFLAAKLTLAEFSVVTKMTTEITTVCGAGNLPRLEELVRDLAEIVCDCIRRAGSTTITVEEIADIAAPEEISEAIGVLMSLGSSPKVAATDATIN